MGPGTETIEKGRGGGVVSNIGLKKEEEGVVEGWPTQPNRNKVIFVPQRRGLGGGGRSTSVKVCSSHLNILYSEAYEHYDLIS